MNENSFQLAQINIARMRAPLDDPVMDGFVRRLPELNALADRSAGFVWRLQGDGGDATYLSPYPDPLIIVNMSVWQSLDALRAYVYDSAHREALRARRQWFGRTDGPSIALWWVPAGHQPSVEEGKDRLEALRLHGESLLAFGLTRPLPPPAEHHDPSDVQDDSIHARPAGPVSYENRVLAVRENSSAGSAGADTIFRYRQHGPHVWAAFRGGAVDHGILVGLAGARSELEVRYHQRTGSGNYRSGRCQAHPETLADGRIRLREKWSFLDGDAENGVTVLEEL